MIILVIILVALGISFFYNLVKLIEREETWMSKKSSHGRLNRLWCVLMSAVGFIIVLFMLQG